MHHRHVRTGCVDERVDAAERLGLRRHGVRGGRLVAEVQGCREDPSPELLDLIRERGGRVPVGAIGEHDVAASLCQGPDDRRTDSPGTARDEGNPRALAEVRHAVTVTFHVHSPLPSHNPRDFAMMTFMTSLVPA